MKQRPAKQAAWENSVKALFFLCGVITVGFVLCISVYLLVSGLPAAEIECSKKQATFYHDAVLADMEALRAAVDAAEALTGGKYLPYPTYGELLFGVNE